MATLESNYGVGVNNRFMLLSEEEEDSATDEVYIAPVKTNVKRNITPTIENLTISKTKSQVNQKEKHDTKPDSKQAQHSKREFDRHSGSDKTGIKAVEKREGGGSYNWGNSKDDYSVDPNLSVIQDENEEWDKPEDIVPKTILGVQGLTATQKAIDTEDFVNSTLNESCEQEDGNTKQQPITPEPVQLTLDEWKALHSSEFIKPEYKIREPGEGEDKTKWKNTYVYKNDTQAKTTEKSHKHVVSNKEHVGAPHGKKILDINVKYVSPFVQRGRGGFRSGLPPTTGYQQQRPAPTNPRFGHSTNETSNQPGTSSPSATMAVNQDGATTNSEIEENTAIPGSPSSRPGNVGGYRGGFRGGRGGGGNRGGFRPQGGSNYRGSAGPGRGGFSRGMGRPPFRGRGRGDSSAGGYYSYGAAGNEFESQQSPVFNAEADFPSLRPVSAK